MGSIGSVKDHLLIWCFVSGGIFPALKSGWRVPSGLETVYLVEVRVV